MKDPARIIQEALVAYYTPLFPSVSFRVEDDNDPPALPMMTLSMPEHDYETSTHPKLPLYSMEWSFFYDPTELSREGAHDLVYNILAASPAAWSAADASLVTAGYVGLRRWKLLTRTPDLPGDHLRGMTISYELAVTLADALSDCPL